MVDLFSQTDMPEPAGNPTKKASAGKKRGRTSLSEPYDGEVLRMVRAMELTKRYYPIGEVAEMFRVNTSLIRYWEKEFDILKPKKNRKGDRLFRPEDIRHLELIYYLLRERKFTIEGVRKKLREDRKGMEQNFEMVQSLQKVRRFLVELKDQL